MKLFLVSDIHIEMAHHQAYMTFNHKKLRFSYPREADVIVLCGDIGERTNGLEWARKRFSTKDIIYVPGNHEYYESDLSALDDMRAKARELDIHFLEKDAVIIDGVRFLGTTLWTDFDRYSIEAVTTAERDMNDYRYIKCQQWWQNTDNLEQAKELMTALTDSFFGFDPVYFSPTVAYLLHQQSLSWLDQQLAQQYEGKTVVVTHHAPSLRSTEDNDFTYASNLEEFIAKRANCINLWCHGHIHKPVDYRVANVRIVSNPRGYPKYLCPEFSVNKLIELEHE